MGGSHPSCWSSAGLCRRVPSFVPQSRDSGVAFCADGAKWWWVMDSNRGWSLRKCTKEELVAKPVHLAPHDGTHFECATSDLAVIVEAWGRMTPAVRAAILALVLASGGSDRP